MKTESFENTESLLNALAALAQSPSLEKQEVTLTGLDQLIKKTALSLGGHKPRTQQRLRG